MVKNIDMTVICLVSLMLVEPSFGDLYLESPTLFHNITPSHIGCWEETVLEYSFVSSAKAETVRNFICSSMNDNVAKVSNSTIVIFNSMENITVFNVSLWIGANNLGRATIVCIYEFLNTTVLRKILVLTVKKTFTTSEIIFRICVVGFVLFLSFLMGCTVDRAVIRVPLNILFGCLGQFMFMPLLAIVTSLISSLDKEFCFGLIIIGLCPGGCGSNLYSLLLKRHSSLSIAVTFVNLVTGLVMLPLWVFCIEKFYLGYQLITIDYILIPLLLIAVLIPMGIGILLRKKNNSIALKIVSFMNLYLIGFVVFSLTFGVYANLFIYTLIVSHPILAVIAAIFPWLGFVLSYSLGLLFHQTFMSCMTSTWETGLLNLTIAVVFLRFFLPNPYGDLSSAIVVITMVLVPIPLILAYFVVLMMTLIRKCVRLNAKENNEPPMFASLNSRTTDDPDRKQFRKKLSTFEPVLYYTEETSGYMGNPMEEYYV